MQSLAIRQRGRLGARAPWHVGDIAWALFQHAGREDEWEFRTWDDRAWSWLKLDNGTLEFDTSDDALLDEILSEERATTVWGFEELVPAFGRHGFTRPGESMHFYVCDDLGLTAPTLPDGFRLRTVEPDDLAERVAVHRDVWAPSRVTEESYANVQAAWPYRASLDCVVEAPGGRFAAYALLWPDDENRVGELEPVGCREGFRRRGLAAAVCTYALRRWREEGGREAIVYCMSDAACRLYESVGFRRHATLTGYSR